MRVGEVTMRDDRIATPDQTIQEAARVMADVDMGILPPVWRSPERHLRARRAARSDGWRPTWPSGNGAPCGLIAVRWRPETRAQSAMPSSFRHGP